MQCVGYRGDGETFTADVWFSTYHEGTRPKLAAIVADVTEEVGPAGSPASPAKRGERMALSPRETEVLRCLVQGFANKEIAARMGISESAVKHVFQQLFG